MINLTNTAAYEAKSETKILVTALQNVKGVHIKTLSLQAATNNNSYHVKIGNDYLMRGASWSTTSFGLGAYVFVTDILVPKGKAIELYTDHSSATINIFYEVL